MRQLSPYQGTIQVAQRNGSRAMSVDGVDWQTQIKRKGARFSTRGIWRSDGGGDLEEDELTESFIQDLKNAPELPFPFADKLELWLLDSQSQMPMALVTSTLDRETAPRINDVHWQATLADDYSFVAPSLGRASAALSTTLTHRDLLQRCVQAAAGSRPRAQWFRRDEQGGGSGFNGCRIDDSLEGRQLTAQQFPELLLRVQWPHDEETALVRDYHAWHSPWLLTHSDISDETRDWLEHAACNHPQQLFRARKLLPKVINKEMLKKAWVAMAIRQSNTATQ